MNSVLILQSAAAILAEREFEQLAAAIVADEAVDGFRVERILKAAGRDMTALTAACERHAADLDRFADDGGRVHEAT